MLEPQRTPKAYLHSVVNPEIVGIDGGFGLNTCCKRSIRTSPHFIQRNTYTPNVKIHPHLTVDTCRKCQWGIITNYWYKPSTKTWSLTYRNCSSLSIRLSRPSREMFDPAMILRTSSRIVSMYLNSLSNAPGAPPSSISLPFFSRIVVSTANNIYKIYYLKSECHGIRLLAWPSESILSVRGVGYVDCRRVNICQGVYRSWELPHLWCRRETACGDGQVLQSYTRYKCSTNVCKVWHVVIRRWQTSAKSIE